jgi:hypothetical protein
MLGDKAGHNIGATPGRKRNDHRHRPSRVGLPIRKMGHARHATAAPARRKNWRRKRGMVCSRQLGQTERAPSVPKINEEEVRPPMAFLLPLRPWDYGRCPWQLMPLLSM